MRPGYISGPNAPLIRTPSYRHQSTRRWLSVVAAILALALVSGLIGSLVQPARNLPSPPAAGPFSYFPSV